MKIRGNDFGTIVIYGACIAAVALITFASVNAGVDPRAGHRFDGIAPSIASGVCLGLILFCHAGAIAALDADDRVRPEARQPDPRTPRPPDSFTWFIHVPIHRLLLIGPIWAAFSVSAVLICHLFAKYPGVPGTVWGEYTQSLLPAVSLGCLAWSAANFCFAWSALAEAVNRDRRQLYLTVLTCGFVIGCGTAGGFGLVILPSLSPLGAFVLGAIGLILTTALLVPLRAWAIRRVGRFDSGELTRTEAVHRRQRAGAPPHDALHSGEKMLAAYSGDRLRDHAGDPQMIVFTDQRIFRASITAQGRTFILEQAQPGQLSGGTSETRGDQVITTALFHDRQPMSIYGGGEEKSRRFAESISVLARTGSFPR